MGALQVFNLQEKVIGKQGAGATCPYCGGPVLAWDFDSHLLFCFIPITRHKTKTKFYCTICSTRLVPSTNA
ncbi:methionyl-tRNA synthetase [Parasponia andersonii]|uniref:Methionyl-tRNA synthetase n=1 Tax=Parasponia andersonii TaxID=3476 RepID=A0A2P5BWL4_PARAD|nr:methionyl-tRNA synthetase [Parasponia andersonii]